MSREALDKLLVGEDLKKDKVQIKDAAGNLVKTEKFSYKDVWLMDESINWLYPVDWKEGDEREFNYHFLALKFYFPKLN